MARELSQPLISWEAMEEFMEAAQKNVDNSHEEAWLTSASQIVSSMQMPNRFIVAIFLNAYHYFLNHAVIYNRRQHYSTSENNSAFILNILYINN